jgi:hypothetical protein
VVTLEDRVVDTRVVNRVVSRLVHIEVFLIASVLFSSLRVLSVSDPS